MLIIKLLRKFILPLWIPVVMVGCGVDAEFADKLAQQRDPKVERPQTPQPPQDPQTPAPPRKPHDPKKRIRELYLQPLTKNPGPDASADKEAPRQVLAPKVLNELLGGINNNHREKLTAVRSRLSPQAVAAVDAAMTQDIDALRRTLNGTRNYHQIEYRLQRLAWLDVLLSPTELAGISMLDVLESIVGQQQLDQFLTRYGWGVQGWMWFYFSLPSLSPPSPSQAPGDNAVWKYHSRMHVESFLLSHHTDPSFFLRVDRRVGRVLRQRTEQLIARDAEALRWLRSLGYGELADSLPPAQQPQGNDRFHMMHHYLESVPDEKHRRQLQLLVPQIPGGFVLYAMLFFVAGAEDTRYHLTVMGELLKVMAITELTGSQPEFWIDQGDYDYMKEAYDTHFDSAPGKSDVAFHVEQFSIPRKP